MLFPETNEPVTENTIYGLTSVSKHFTTTLLGQALSNAGKKKLSKLFRSHVVDVFHSTNTCNCDWYSPHLLTVLFSLGKSWDTKVHDILADLGTEFYFYDPLRSNLTSLKDLGSHSTGIARNDYMMILQNMSRSEQADRLR